MRILATADLHGNLPEIPKCDLLLIGGDICPLSFDRDLKRCLHWLDTKFHSWLSDIDASTIVGIAGNHDFIFEPPNDLSVAELHLPWRYLRDERTVAKGLTVYGLPWVPNLKAWAFYADKEGLKLRYDAIPKGVDIVLSHGPPFGFGDRMCGGTLIGCKSATDMIARVKPKALVCGHIHEGFGHYRFTGRNHLTDIYNVSYVDEFYTPRGQIIDIMIDATEDPPEPEREVRSADPDARHAAQSAEGSEPAELAVA